MKLIKKQNDNIQEATLTFEYKKWDQDLEDIYCFIQGIAETIPGYTENKSLCNVKIGDILYFEAVGELVFAYTASEVYDIKMRLYQVEEFLEKTSFLRASKSVLVNMKKIERLKSALNGRMIATMKNGEEVLISRKIFLSGQS